MTIEVNDVDEKKVIEKFFAEELPAIGVRVNRNIFEAANELAWPMPPQPSAEGKFVRWREYCSVVSWKDRHLTMIRKVGGVGRVREVVLAYRLQEQVDRFVFDLNEILYGIGELASMSLSPDQFEVKKVDDGS